MVKHGSLPVTEGVEVNLQYSRVLKLLCDALSLLAEVTGMMVDGHVWISEDPVSIVLRKRLEHAAEFVAYRQDSRVASFFWSHVDYFRFEVYVVPFELPDFTASCANKDLG